VVITQGEEEKVPPQYPLLWKLGEEEEEEEE